MTRNNTPNPFDKDLIELQIKMANEKLDSIELSEKDQKLREWIPDFFQDPLEHKHALNTLYKRATGTLTARLDRQPEKEAI